MQRSLCQWILVINKLPTVNQIKSESNPHLQSVPEDKHLKFTKAMSFLKTQNQSSIAKLPVRKTSHEIINEVFQNSKNNNLNNDVAIISPTSSNNILAIDGIVDLSNQSQKPIKAKQVKNATSMNENGLLKIILNRVDKQKGFKLKDNKQIKIE